MAFTEDPPIDWPLYDAIDPAGGGKTGYLIASVDPGGGIWIVDEYLEAARDITQHAASIKEKRKAAIDRGYKFQGTLIDPKANRRDVGTSIDERSKEWLTVRVQYRNAGIPTRLANNNIDAGIERLCTLITQGLFHVHKRCEQLNVQRLGYYYNKPDGVGKVKPVDADNDLMDLARYLAMGPLSARLNTGPETKVVSIFKSLSISEEMEQRMLAKSKRQRRIIG